MSGPTSARPPRRGALERLSPRHRQYALLAAISPGRGTAVAGLASSENGSKDPHAKPPGTPPSAVTNLGVMPPGQQVNPVDQWVGTAGSKLAQYESEREEQDRLNKARQAFEAQTMKRFADLEQRLTANAPPQPPGATPVPPAPVAPVVMPPAASLPMPPPPPPAMRSSASGVMPPGTPNLPMPTVPPEPPRPALMRITLADRPANAATPGTSPERARPASAETHTVSTFLPVSFTRGTLLGGLDAPTGGQAQSNPHPVLIRLSDNSVLPNRSRGEYRDCFVVAAGYGDISAERAYLRTESRSCVRADGAALEVKIQGSIWRGWRGRHARPPGHQAGRCRQCAAGRRGQRHGQWPAISSTSYSTSALGTVATASGPTPCRRAAPCRRR